MTQMYCSVTKRQVRLTLKTTYSILELLKKVNEQLGITIVIITHEMQVVKEICNKVAVMEDGEVIEQGTVLDIFTNPTTQLNKKTSLTLQLISTKELKQFSHTNSY